MKSISRRRYLQVAEIALVSAFSGCIAVTPPPPRENVIGVVVTNSRGETVTIIITGKHDSLDASWESTETIPPGETYTVPDVLPPGNYRFNVTEAENGDSGEMNNQNPRMFHLQVEGCPQNNILFELKTVRVGDSGTDDVIEFSKQKNCN